MYYDGKFLWIHDFLKYEAGVRAQIVLQFVSFIHIFYHIIEILYWIISASID